MNTGAFPADVTGSYRRGKPIVKMTKIAIVILAIALALYILIPGLSWGEDGTALHGARRSFRCLPGVAPSPAMCKVC